MPAHRKVTHYQLQHYTCFSPTALPEISFDSFGPSVLSKEISMRPIRGYTVSV